MHDFFVFKRYTQAVFVKPIAHSRVPCTIQLQCCGWCETNSRNIFLTRRARQPRRAVIGTALVGHADLGVPYEEGEARSACRNVPNRYEATRGFLPFERMFPRRCSRGAICRRSISSSPRSTVFRQSSGSSKFSRRVIVGLDYAGLAKDFKESISTQRPPSCFIEYHLEKSQSFRFNSIYYTNTEEQNCAK